MELLGVTPDFPSVREVEVADGRFISDRELEDEAKVAVLGAGLAEELFGDADPIGENVIVGTTKLTVIGVMEERGSVGGENWDDRLYMPITLVFSKFSFNAFSIGGGRNVVRMEAIIGNTVRIIYVQAESQEAIDETITQVSLLLAKRHDVSLDEPDFNVQTQQDIIETQESTTAAFRSLLSWGAGVSLVVGGIGIMNIMLVSVTERTREIGIRQAVGATQNDIRAQFLSEALMLSLVGGLLGVLSGVVGSWIFGAAGDMRTVIVPSSIVLAFFSAAVVGIFFGYYPANQAAKLDPIESLRHE